MGGCDLVLKYDGSEWSMMEPLLEPRWLHRSVIVANAIVHVGGIGKQYFEKWIWENSQFTIKQSTEYLDDYDMWPETFVVSADYCK